MDTLVVAIVDQIDERGAHIHAGAALHPGGLLQDHIGGMQ